MTGDEDAEDITYTPLDCAEQLARVAAERDALRARVAWLERVREAAQAYRAAYDADTSEEENAARHALDAVLGEHRRRQPGGYTGTYNVLGDGPLPPEQAAEAERQIAQADGEVAQPAAADGGSGG